MMKKRRASAASNRQPTWQRVVDRPTDIELRFGKSRWIPIFWTIIAIVVLNLLTGIVSYSFMIIRCGSLPITASTFASDYHYYILGQVGYGPSMLHDVYFCSTEEAERAGFNPY